MLGAVEPQVTLLVMSVVLPSVFVAVAMNWTGTPCGSETPEPPEGSEPRVAGATAIEATAADVTVKFVEPVIPA
jgi:hypothetical protein